MDADQVSVDVGEVTLDESKLYRLNSGENFLDFLKPDINTLMLTEIQMDELFPRQESDGDHTRIFINYTNNKGNSLVYKVMDEERLSRTFDIDGFVNGFFATVNEGSEYHDLVTLIRPALVTAIDTSVSNVLEMGDERILPQVKYTSQIVLQSLVAILLDDPRDAIILVKEEERDEDIKTIVLGIWAIKTRD